VIRDRLLTERPAARTLARELSEPGPQGEGRALIGDVEGVAQGTRFSWHVRARGEVPGVFLEFDTRGDAEVGAWCANRLGVFAHARHGEQGACRRSGRTISSGPTQVFHVGAPNRKVPTQLRHARVDKMSMNEDAAAALVEALLEDADLLAVRFGPLVLELRRGDGWVSGTWSVPTIAGSRSMCGRLDAVCLRGFRSRPMSDQPSLDPSGGSAEARSP